jgi:hypothetical protein
VTLDRFVADCKLSSLPELDRALFIAFFYLRKANIQEFNAADCAHWLGDLNFAKPNTTRLTARLKTSENTVRGSRAGYFRLHHDYQRKMDARFPQLTEKSQEVLDHGTVIPPAPYENTRGYIQSLAKQINRSYEDNIFDGCAVLMRRLEEVLLILSYENLKIADSIKDASGHYLLLEGIVSDATGNGTLNLSRNSRKSIEVFRNLGNYSAHKITYTCKREYIKEKIDEYRALIDELLHKGGLRT